MFVLISNDQVCGFSNSEDGLPAGFSAIAYDGDLPIEQLEFADGKLREKQPLKVLEVLEPLVLPEFTGPDWAGFQQAVRGTELWTAAYAAAQKSLKAQAHWTLLLHSIDASQNLQDFAFALRSLIENQPSFFPFELRDELAKLLETHRLAMEDLMLFLVGEV